MYPLLMPRLPKQNYHDIERIIEVDFLRATEAAALNSLKWLGRGDKEAADAAASDAIRGMFDLMNICGEVVIGEGIKDNAPGIFKGEQLGTWLPGTPQFDIAIDPIDGTTNISKGAPNSISCIAAASPEDGVKVALRDIPSFYMTKLSYGPRVIQYMQRRGDDLKLEAPIPETLAIVARALDKRIQDVVVMMLDRPRHKEIVDQIRGVGASLRMIGDGDIAAAMAPAIPDSGIDLYMGIGGSPEAVLAAAGIKCLGGEMQCKMWPRDEKERKKLIEDGYEKEARPHLFGRRPGEWKKHHLLRDRDQRQRAPARGSFPGGNRHHPFNSDAGEKPDRSFHPGQPRSHPKNHPPPHHQPRGPHLILMTMFAEGRIRRGELLLAFGSA